MPAQTMDIHCGSSTTTIADALRMLEGEQVGYVAVVEAGRVTASRAPGRGRGCRPAARRQRTKAPSRISTWPSTVIVERVVTMSRCVAAVLSAPVSWGVGVAEGDVHARKLLVLQQVAREPGQGDVGPDGVFADAVALWVSVQVLVELGGQLC
jgi:hypothetical protein